MPTIRDTIDPLREREVSDEEFTDLDRQGIVLTGTRAKTPEGLHAAAVRQVTAQLEGQLAGELADRPPSPPAPETAEVSVVDDGEHQVEVDDGQHDQDPGG